MKGLTPNIGDWQTLAHRAKFRPASMAALCCISLRQLERHFANQFHTTPRSWTQHLRLRLAKELLSRGFTNKAVVAELGFTDNAHLCREFKKRCGNTPRCYAPSTLGNPAGAAPDGQPATFNLGSAIHARNAVAHM
jgi:transcriptional regulator GlxA family with amidase domain